VKLSYLDILPSGSRVNVENLIKFGVVDATSAKDCGIKILGDGEVRKKFTIELPISKSAAKRVEKAGGKVSVVTDSKAVNK
jgi:ribosomal protein L15